VCSRESKKRSNLTHLNQDISFWSLSMWTVIVYEEAVIFFGKHLRLIDVVKYGIHLRPPMRNLEIIFVMFDSSRAGVLPVASYI
jgi:hypothetical protein